MQESVLSVKVQEEKENWIPFPAPLKKVGVGIVTYDKKFKLLSTLSVLKQHVFLISLERFHRGKTKQNPTDAGSYDLRNITKLQKAKIRSKNPKTIIIQPPQIPNHHTNKEKKKSQTVPNKNKANEPTENCLANIFLVVPNILAGKSCGVYCFFFFFSLSYSPRNLLYITDFSQRFQPLASFCVLSSEELSLWGREEKWAPDPGEAKRTPPLMSPNSKLVLRIPEAELCYSEDADVTEGAPTWRWRSRLYHRPGAG